MAEKWYNEFKEYVQGEWSDIMIIEMVKQLGKRYPDKCVEVIKRLVEWKIDESGQLAIIENHTDLTIILRTNFQLQGQHQLKIEFVENEMRHHFDYARTQGNTDILFKLVVLHDTTRKIEEKLYFHKNTVIQGNTETIIRVNKESRNEDGAWTQTYVEEDIAKTGERERLLIKEPNRKAEHTAKKIHIKQYKDEKMHGYEWIKSPDGKVTWEINLWKNGQLVKKQVYHRKKINVSLLHYEHYVTPEQYKTGPIIYFNTENWWYKAEFWDSGTLTSVYTSNTWPAVSLDQIKLCLEIDERTAQAKKELDEQAKERIDAILKRKN